MAIIPFLPGKSILATSCLSGFDSNNLIAFSILYCISQFLVIMMKHLRCGAHIAHVRLRHSFHVLIPISEYLSSPNCSVPSLAPCNAPGRQFMMVQSIRIPATCLGDLNGLPGSWLQSGLVMAIETTWRVNLPVWWNRPNQHLECLNPVVECLGLSTHFCFQTSCFSLSHLSLSVSPSLCVFF